MDNLTRDDFNPLATDKEYNDFMLLYGPDVPGSREFLNILKAVFMDPGVRDCLFFSIQKNNVNPNPRFDKLVGKVTTCGRDKTSIILQSVNDPMIDNISHGMNTGVKFFIDMDNQNYYIFIQNKMLDKEGQKFIKELFKIIKK